MNPVYNKAGLMGGASKPPPNKPIPTKFSEIYRFEKVNTLLNPVSQYENLMGMRQKNDTVSVKTADVVNKTLLPLPTSPTAFNDASHISKPIMVKAKSEINEPIQIIEDNILVLPVKCDKYLLSNSIVGYGNSKDLLLPIGDMARTLDFNINVDVEKGTANGWFISEDRNFSIDMSSMKAETDGKSFNIPKGDIKTFNDEIFVDSKVLEKLFPVEIDYQFQDQSIDIIPREQLPFQARLEREARRNKDRNSSFGEPVFPRATSGYSMFEIPTMDIGVETKYNTNTDSSTKFKTDYYFLSQGDLAKMTSEIFIDGSEDGLENTRLSLYRKDPSGELLGPLKATNIALGDVRTLSLPIVGGGGNEKGIALGNEDLYRTSDFDTTYFEGDIPPGWDVELYRNDILVNSKRVGVEGRYDFKDVQVYYGKNDFHLIFYGPQGQKKEETKSINVGSEMLKKGQSEYQISVTEQGKHLYDPSYPSFDIDDEILKFDKEKLKMVAKYQYGLGSDVSLEGGILSQIAGSKRRNYLDLGIKTSFEDIYLEADIIHDIGGGSAAEVLAQTKVGDLYLKFKQQFYDKFQDYNDVSNDYLLKFRSEASIAGKIDGGEHLPDFPFSLTYTDTTSNSYHNSYFGGAIAMSVKNLSFTNNLRWYDKSYDDETDRNNETEPSSKFDGSFQATTQIGPVSVRGGVNYEIQPENKITSGSLSNQFNITEDLSSTISLNKNFDDDGDITGGISLNWKSKNDKYILTPSVSYDGKDNFAASVLFSTSIGFEPRSQKFYFSSEKNADKGSISARVYLDKNGNKRYDLEDEPIEGATVMAVQARKEAKTDENGIAFIPGINPVKPTDMMVEMGTLEDPFWQPSRQERSMVPRAGHVEFVDIPVIATGEVDGTVFMATEDGSEKSVPNVSVQLIDDSGKVVKKTRSAYDGFYLFDSVVPGNYSVKIDPADVKKQGGVTTTGLDIDITNDGNVVNGVDIILGKPITKTVKSDKSVKSKLAAIDKKETNLNKIVEKSLGEATKTETLNDKILKKLASELELSSIEKASFMQQDKALVKTKKSLKARTKPDAIKPDAIKPEEVKNNTKGQTSLDFHDKILKKLASELGLSSIDKASFMQQDEALIKTKKSLKARTKPNAIKTDTIKPDVIKSEEVKNSIKGQTPVNEPLEVPVKKDGSVKVNNIISAPVHNVQMASYKSYENAVKGVKVLQKKFVGLQQGDFTIKKVNLGAEKGIWYRVFAKSSNNIEHIRTTGKIPETITKIETSQAQPEKIKSRNGFSVHVASFRTNKRALQGLQNLQNKFDSILGGNKLSIKRVNLGTKGVWYRVLVGNFENKKVAVPLMNSLKKKGQYATILS